MRRSPLLLLTVLAVCVPSAAAAQIAEPGEGRPLTIATSPPPKNTVRLDGAVMGFQVGGWNLGLEEPGVKPLGDAKFRIDSGAQATVAGLGLTISRRYHRPWLRLPIARFSAAAGNVDTRTLAVQTDTHRFEMVPDWVGVLRFSVGVGVEKSFGPLTPYASAHAGVRMTSMRLAIEERGVEIGREWASRGTFDLSAEAGARVAVSKRGEVSVGWIETLPRGRGLMVSLKLVGPLPFATPRSRR